MTAEEFEEIALTGGRFEFRREKGGISYSYRNSNPWPASIYMFCVSPQGRLLDVVDPVGMGQRPTYPQPSYVVQLISDRNGMVGRICPACGSYFRMDSMPHQAACPYCGTVRPSVEFTTKNQLAFMQEYLDALLRVEKDEESMVLDLDQVNASLPDNRPQWAYSEEKQQTSHACSRCSTRFDILGEYGICPQCREPNALQVFSSKMDKIQQQFEKADSELDDREDRGVEWRKLVTVCVSEFEAMANELRTHLLLLPMTPRRKKELERLSFQNLLSASDCLEQWYRFSILDGIKPADRQFLNTMFNRRHLFTHKGGRVDQEYLERTGDRSVRLNQVVRPRSSEVRRLVGLVRKCGENLISGIQSLA